MEHERDEHKHSAHTTTHTRHSKPAKGTEKAIYWIGGIQIVLMIILIFQVNGLPAKLGGSALPTPEGTVDVKPAAPAPTAPAPTAPTPNLDMSKLMDDDAVKGDTNAPVTIVEWSDYQCPFCGRFYRDTEGQIQKNYIDTGKVKLVYRDFPLSFHENAQKAAETAECAGEQGKYWEMHDKLFESGVNGGVEGFKQYAKDLGLDTTKFDNCLDSGAMASETQKDFRDGQAAGIRGTPGFIINGKLVSGAQPYSAFQAAIDAALAAN